MPLVTDLELPGALDLHGGVEGHLEVVVGVLGEDALEGLLEEGRVERVPHDHVPASVVAAALHLHQPRLVEGA